MQLKLKNVDIKQSCEKLVCCFDQPLKRLDPFFASYRHRAGMDGQKKIFAVSSHRSLGENLR